MVVLFAVFRLCLCWIGLVWFDYVVSLEQEGREKKSKWQLFARSVWYSMSFLSFFRSFRFPCVVLTSKWKERSVSVCLGVKEKSTAWLLSLALSLSLSLSLSALVSTEPVEVGNVVGCSRI